MPMELAKKDLVFKKEEINCDIIKQYKNDEL